ncbi:MAG: efflux transporter outer membrane subunit [Simkaniaceae bacterium]|nr:efflux transporter outer membrane subunit [Simkaniaceae bacterium]MCF7852206.1 efflux transporter outer membrane subunit [Simkaniaceae bacterium]
MRLSFLKLRSYVLIAMGFASLLLTSCSLSMSKEEKLQKIISPPNLDSSLVSINEHLDIEKHRWPSSNWWEQYQINELNFLVESALCNNPSLQAIKEKIDYAKGEAVIARSKLFPLLFFNASDQWEYLSHNGLYRALNPNIKINNQQIDFSLSFSYEFDFWGKYRNLYRAALGRERASLAETEQIKLVISAALCQAYFALRTNLMLKEIYEEIYRARQNIYVLQIDRLDNSLDSALTPLLSEESLLEAAQWLDQIQQEIAQNSHLVNILAGHGPDTPLKLDEPLMACSPQLIVPDHISAELLSRRPDLKAQIWRVDALSHEVGAARADFWPNINLIALAGFQSGSWSNLFDWMSRTISALPALSLPLYTSGAIGANIDAKKALFYEAVYEYNDLILKSFQQVSDLLAMGQAVYLEKKKQEEILSNANQRYTLTYDRLNCGIDNALTTYRILEEWLQKKLANTHLLYQQYLVSIQLTKSLGGGYVDE